MRKEQRTARYESIAREIAAQVVRGVYPEGCRLHGRSTLAGLYKVSPETIRKAMALLEEHQVVEIIHGSGVRVLSQEQAQKYLDMQRTQSELVELLGCLQAMVAEQKRIIGQMEESIREVTSLVRRD